MKVKTKQDAWKEVDRIFPYDYEKDEQASITAGYPIYTATASGHKNNWISDLGTTLEVNTEDGKSIRISIEPEELHHYDVIVFAKHHNFTFQCSTIYEALDAIVDAGISFGFEVDANKVMIDLVQMETGDKISFENYKFGITKRKGEI